VEDAVYIWSAEGAAPPPHPAAPPRRPSALAGGPFVLESLLALEDTASAVAWLDSGGLAPLLAVGYAGGALELFGRDRRCGPGRPGGRLLLALFGGAGRGGPLRALAHIVG
jgi:hypothetical protein